MTITKILLGVAALEAWLTNMTTNPGQIPDQIDDGDYGNAWASGLQIQRNSVPSGAYTYYIRKDWGVGRARKLTQAISRGSSDTGHSDASGTWTWYMKCQGSNDGSSWDDLADGEVTVTNGVDDVTITANPTDTTVYRYHRIIFKHNRGSAANLGTQEVELTAI